MLQSLHSLRIKRFNRPAMQRRAGRTPSTFCLANSEARATMVISRTSKRLAVSAMPKLLLVGNPSRTLASRQDSFCGLGTRSGTTVAVPASSARKRRKSIWCQISFWFDMKPILNWLSSAVRLQATGWLDLKEHAPSISAKNNVVIFRSPHKRGGSNHRISI